MKEDETPKEYIGAVRRFVDWVEKKEADHSKQNLEEGLAICAELFWRSSILPAVNKTEEVDDVIDDLIFTMEEGGADDSIRTRFASISYRQDDDPTDMLGMMGPSIAEMADGMATTYSCIKRGLTIFDGGDQDRALKTWRLGYEQEWGAFLADGLLVLHSMLYNP